NGTRPSAVAVVTAVIRPVPPTAEVTDQSGQLLLQLRALLLSYGRHRDAVLAEDLQRDPLPHLHGQGWIGEHLHVGVAVRVDEARTHDVTRAVAALVAGEAMSHRHDAAVLHRGVGRTRR